MGEPTNKLLVVMVGFPYSGKSTWAKAQNIPIVNPDAIRLAMHGQRFERLAEDLVWAVAKIMVRSLFGAGHEIVIADGCHNTKKRREWWFDQNWVIEYKIIDTPESVCLLRAKHDFDDQIMPVIQKMAIEHEPVTAAEYKGPIHSAEYKGPVRSE